ncbi:threonine/homoserine/homoserine lactone efflux protein [Litoreibacter ponti]|uniref:Threonine/homoserine/homoserine lactone efflux protein n=1 Tax=Litoreibacter ponti TaxID=1510457 RepID=A0A2T6BML3_9RHOB|nr:LysE family transporter [Litoreibacter ponti]PTX57301.1 threonine/homoserine/homoserine lactone efflux protein [Litoreibacter ponti]
MTGALLASLAAFLVAAGSPGPATLSAAHVAMAHGRAAGLAHGMGLALGLFVWGVLAAFGLGAFIIGFAPALVALKVAGGLFLLWLAWGCGRRALGTEAATSTGPSQRFFRRGVLLNLANPKAIFAWLSVIAVGMPETPDRMFVVTATLACGALGVAIYAAIAVGFARPRVMSVYASWRRWIDGACAALFAGAGLKLLASRA